MKTRRQFMAWTGATAVWSAAGQAQQQAPVVGFLSARSPSESADLVESFRKGLRQLGFIEGRGIVIAFRWAEGRYERLQALASDLVGLNVSVLFAAGGSLSARAAKAATTTIPVIFVASDPVTFGLVASLNRPGGNVTGVSNLATDLPTKSTALLKQLVPSANVIAYLVNPTNPGADANTKQALIAAEALGIRLEVRTVTTLRELDDAFESLAKQQIFALLVMADAFFDSQREHIIELSARYGIVGCYPWRDYVIAGGAMSYGTNLSETYRQAGIYAGRILRGEKPSDLPVIQPTKIEMVLNLKAIGAMGLSVPPTLLAIADDVIE